MYICVCNAIRERDFRACALVCDGDAESIYAELGYTPQCRQCLDEAADILADERLAHRLPVCQ